MANLAGLKSKVVGPLPPGDFSRTPTAIEALIDAGFDAVTDANSADTIAGLDTITVMGNVYIIIIYKA